MKGKRPSQVAEIVRRVVAAELFMATPELATSVTVTHVEVTPDLRHGIIWVGCTPEVETADVLVRLGKANHVFQRAVAAALATKFTPRLQFRLDESGAYAQEIDELLKRV